MSNEINNEIHNLVRSDDETARAVALVLLAMTQKLNDISKSQEQQKKELDEIKEYVAPLKTVRGAKEIVIWVAGIAMAITTIVGFIKVWK